MLRWLEGPGEGDGFANPSSTHKAGRAAAAAVEVARDQVAAAAQRARRALEVGPDLSADLLLAGLLGRIELREGRGCEEDRNGAGEQGQGCAAGAEVMHWGVLLPLHGPDAGLVMQGSNTRNAADTVPSTSTDCQGRIDHGVKRIPLAGSDW